MHQTTYPLWAQFLAGPEATQHSRFHKAVSSSGKTATGSCLKTGALCATATGFAATGTVTVLMTGSGPLAWTFAAAGVVLTSAAFVMLLASLVVLARLRRSERFESDLFLQLNRSRDASAILCAPPMRAGLLRRGLAHRILGHDLIVGEEVEVKSWPEIHATLDKQGCLDRLPFMPEMLAMCGRRARVFRSMHRLFDYRKSRRMRHMRGSVLLVGVDCNGSAHGGCEAACHTIWNAAWLRRIEPLAAAPAEGALRSFDHSTSAPVFAFGTTPPRFQCQLTLLHDASQPIERLTLAEFLRPLVSGNVSLSAFLAGWLTNLFNDLQRVRGGTGFPTFEGEPLVSARLADETYAAGDHVRVKPAIEVRATLNDQLKHRGLWFDPDMQKHCGRPAIVRSEVRQLIDIVTGEMLMMKTPCYILQDVHFSGERQLFNSQYEPLFWRSAWLDRVKV